MHRIFIEEDVFESTIKVCESDSHHLINVLRVNNKEVIAAISPNYTYSCKIKNCEGKNLILNVIERVESTYGAPDIVLFQGLSKSDKMESIIRACSEIGISKFYPLKMERSIANLDKNIDKKINRWQNIAVSAAKQSRGTYIPKVMELVEFRNIEKYLDNDECLIVPYENEENTSIKSIVGKLKNKVSIIIGPEGGFSETEIEKLKHRAHIVTLGNNILRMETAAIVTCYTVMQELRYIND